MHICRIKQKEGKIRMSFEIHKSNVKYDKPDVLDFEDSFNQKFNELLAKGPMTYEDAKDVAVDMQRLPKYKNMADVQQMKFSKNWWRKFQKNRNMRWRRICGTKKIFPMARWMRNEKEFEILSKPIQAEKFGILMKAPFFTNF